MFLLVARALSALGGVAVVLMMLQIAADVLGRIVFHRPLFGTTEIVSQYYMVALIFLPLAYTTRREGHMKVELFTQRLSPRSLAGLEAIVGMATTIMLVWFVWETADAASASFAIGEKMEAGAELLTIWPTRWLLPIGLGALAVQQIIQIADDIRVARGGAPTPHQSEASIHDTPGRSGDQS